MSTNQKKIDPAKRLREYDRKMLRSTFVSLFWGVISERRRRSKFTLQSLADKLGTDKSAVSRWFSGELPNWTVDKIADVAGVLDLELRIEATDKSGSVFTASGAITQSATPSPTSLTSSESSPRPQITVRVTDPEIRAAVGW
jgi:transcriptional regulator with XRE-family HTH domain